MLGVVGAMAALSIDVVTLYTARSEAQLAADSAALAGARALANSGMTSDASGGLTAAAEVGATAVATQVATQNQVGGRNLVAAEVVVSFAGNTTNPLVTVRVQRTDLPTFFARIWGTRQLTVAASATAEAYNPSGADALGLVPIPVAPICVKPWLLPNIDPSGGGTIFDTTPTNSGAITNAGLLGWTTPADPVGPAPNLMRLHAACIDCTTLPPPTAGVWQYYPGNTATTFPPPTQALPSCTPPLTPAYQKSVAGCIQTPIACNSTAMIDISDYSARSIETAQGVNCLTHAAADRGDTVDSPSPPTAPFEFIAGADNPIAAVDPSFAGQELMVSDSLVTVPVFNSVSGTPPFNPVTIIGFVQLFLNPDGAQTPTTGPNTGYVKTTVINMAGCGTSAAGPPIFGNGASPVAVRLVSPP